jgi:S-adenosylmethionine:tRNA ribosyltransferase-isomerase
MEPGARTSDYDFALPESRIAQVPAERRDASRLMIVDRASGSIAHATFREIETLIPAGDAIVVNATRVIRSRLLGTRDSGAPAEVFLMRVFADGDWEAMVHPGAKLKPGRRVHVAPDFDIELLETTGRGTRRVRLHSALPVDDALERYGHVPLPPYVARADDARDAERYQTVYGHTPGSVAAPTAGLHFTPKLLAGLEARGVARAEVVLHVGAGTFKPVIDDDPAAHVMHEEWCTIPDDAARIVNETRASGGRIWAVGTTSVRTLESFADETGRVSAGSRETRIFIRPPYRFRAVDHLVTNFHLPRSTLIMLVAAFAGYELTMRAYQEAIDAGYRFFSYGDAMLVL